MSGIQILDHDHLEAGSTALTRGNSGPGQEEFPDTVPARAVLGLDGLGIAEPVAIPAPDGARVMDAYRINAKVRVSMYNESVLLLVCSPLDLPSGALKTANVISKRG